MEILKTYQIKLIDNGPKSLSHVWLLNSMRCEWMDLKKLNVSETSANGISSFNDPWEALNLFAYCLLFC